MSEGQAKSPIDWRVRDAEMFLLDSSGHNSLILDERDLERLRGIAQCAIENANGEVYRQCLTDLVEAAKKVKTLSGGELPYQQELEAAEATLGNSSPTSEQRLDLLG